MLEKLRHMWLEADSTVDVLKKKEKEKKKKITCHLKVKKDATLAEMVLCSWDVMS